jgi:Bacterial Ig-like domain (group 2)
MKQVCLAAALVGLSLFPYLASGSSKAASHRNRNITVAISPSSVTLNASSSQQFTSTVSGTSNPGVTWSATAGTVTATGFFTAPAVLAPTTLRVTATSVVDTTKSATATINVVPVVSIALDPTSVSLNSGASQQFTATVSGSINTGVTWSATNGTVTNGLFTAPNGGPTAYVTATSVADPTKSATATITVLAVTVTVTPTAASLNSGASQQFSATVAGANNADVTWSSTGGTIASDGLFTAPTVSITTTISVTATSIQDASKSATAAVTIAPLPVALSLDNQYCAAGDVPLFDASDGPASLPTSCINTALANTTSPGTKTNVPAGSNLQAAINAAQCGDTLLLAPGATFSGGFTLPAKACDAAHWITIRSGADDSQLPAEETRINPSYAGVTSLPDRPAFNGGTMNVMVKLQTSPGYVFSAAQGANFYRLGPGLEITRPYGTGISYGLVNVHNADHIIFDRDWIHGSPQAEESKRGVYLSGGTNIAIIDSYFNDFMCIAVTGSCTDAQALAGGDGIQVAEHTWKIVNNFMEGAGETILFGGENTGNLSPSDIEIRRNHLYKPPMWNPKASDYIGYSPIVKNLLEIKNGTRVLIEGNYGEYDWGGFTQTGYAVVLTPRGSWAPVQDITIRNNKFSHVGSGLQLAATTSTCVVNGVQSQCDSLAAQRWSIHDLVIDDMNPALYNGSGEMAQISSGFMANAPLNNVAINHVTVFNASNGRVPDELPQVLCSSQCNLLTVGARSDNPAKPYNINITNTIMVAGKYTLWSTTGNGDPTQLCYDNFDPIDMFNQCWSAWSVTGNLVIGYPLTAKPWPTGNYFPPLIASIGFVDAVGGDYRLSPTSAYKGVGTDGNDPGADVTAVDNALAGVR